MQTIKHDYKNLNLIIGADHRGYNAKKLIADYFSAYDVEITDVGSYDSNKVDYPLISAELAKNMQIHHNPIGILICGSGIGVSIAINKYPFIRGALIYNEDIAVLAKQHNNANVLCFGADFFSGEYMLSCTQKFLTTQFDKQKYQHRIQQINDLNLL